MTCPSCAAPASPADRFCEACGDSLAAAGVPFSSSAAPAGCASCGGTVGADGFCTACGRRRNYGLDHAEHELPGITAVTDRGLRKTRNEDAYAIAAAAGVRAAVVCDGVSSVPGSDAAATVAAEAAVAVLAAGGSTQDAYRTASEAVAKLPGTDPPACTYVSAVVAADGTATIGWVGDSRAYWLDDGGARCLTVDDSLAGQLAARGVDAATLRLSAQAAALTRWLGADAPPGDPHLTTWRPPGDGVLLLCSDGLSRYTTWIEHLEHPGDLARPLTDFARQSGGVDNITVVTLPITGGSP